MGRKFRLGRHRKNEERKKLLAESAQLGSCLAEPLVVSLPVQYFMSVPVPSLSVLRQRIQALDVLPQGH